MTTYFSCHKIFFSLQVKYMSPFSNKMPAPAFSLRYFRLNGNKYFPKILMCICDKTTLHTGWRTKCHTIDCARNTFLLLQKHLTSGTELILIKKNSVALVRERTIPTERPPSVGEVSANFCG